MTQVKNRRPYGTSAYAASRSSRRRGSLRERHNGRRSKSAILPPVNLAGWPSRQSNHRDDARCPVRWRPAAAHAEPDKRARPLTYTYAVSIRPEDDRGNFEEWGDVSTALLAALAGIIGIMLGRLWDARSESSRWRRDQKTASYQRLAEAFNVVYENISIRRPDDPGHRRIV